MKIYWKDQAAYDEKDNFLAIIHKMPNNYFCVLLNYPSEEIDYRQLTINEPTIEKAIEQTEAIFKEINDISEIEKLLTSPYNNSELPDKFLAFLSEFSIHRS
jgi:hypothetical protein